MDNQQIQDDKKVNIRKKKSIFKPVTAFIAVLILIAGIVAVNMYYEYLQYAEIGIRYIYMYFTTMTAKIGARVTSFVIVFLFFLMNNIALRRISFKDNKDLAVIRRPVWLVLATLIIAFFASGIISGNVYQDFLTYSQNVKFNQADPIFNQDLSYYIFERPFYISVVNSIKGILMVNVVYTLLVYVILQLRDGVNAIGQTFENKGVLIHCVLNVMFVIISVALSYRFAEENMLFGSFCGVTGAGFTDVKIWSIYYKTAPTLLLLIVPLVIYFLKKARYSRAVVTIMIFPTVWVLTLIIAMVNQSVIVDSDELAMEEQYLQYNLDMTRQAYGLNNIKEKSFDLKNDLTYKEAINNQNVLSAVAADMDEYIFEVNKLQGLGNYYNFPDSDLVPYEVDGVKTFAAISARELANEKIEQTADTYVNKTFKYTHGTGVAVSDLRSGREHFIVRDIPVLSDFGFVNIKQPRIYYGERMNNTVLVNTKYNEIDYMSTEHSAYSYEGFGGIQMTLLNRLVLSLCEKDYQMMMSSQITSESRALINRNIIERVKKIAPFFSYDSDPYMIVTDDGELKWIIDIYTVTNQYPYSTSINGNLNYIRCPAKAVADAYNGAVSFYITDPDDVFIKTYQKIYPTLFEYSAMPEQIAKHLRYPKDIFNIQADIYKQYHVTDAAALYDRNDVWDFAKEKGKRGDTQYVDCYYNAGVESMSLNTMYTSHHTDNINALFSASCDSENYGELSLYRINKEEEVVCSTMYAENIISGDEEITARLDAMRQGGAEVSVGNMQIIPVKNSFIYISPVYVKAVNNSSAYSKLEKVIVVYNSKAAMENSLADSLSAIFGKKPVNAENAVTADDGNDIQGLIDEIIELYENIKQYNSANDWENAGKAMTELDKKINELKARRAELELIEPFVGPPVTAAE